MKKSHRSEFLKDVKSKFPELAEDINREQGNLLFEAAVFRTFIQTKIDAQEKDVVLDAFQLLDKFYTRGNIALNHTIRDLVCEDLELSDTPSLQRKWAFSALPTSLKSARIEWFKFMGYEKE